MNVGKELSASGKLICSVRQGSILGPFLFLLHINDMSMAVNCKLLLYADGTCFLFMGKDTKETEDKLNRDFSSLCERLVDNKLTIHFAEEKTKSILFGNKRHLKRSNNLHIRYGDIKMKQHHKVTYLECILDNNLLGEYRAIKVLGLINKRLKFLYRKQHFLGTPLRRLLCDALIQPHYDYACSAWYPNLNKRLVKKIQTPRNKCILSETRKTELMLESTSSQKSIGCQQWKILNNAFVPSSLNSSPEYVFELYKPFHHGHNTRMSKLQTTLAIQKQQLWPTDPFIPWAQTVIQLTSSCKIKCKCQHV